MHIYHRRIDGKSPISPFLLKPLSSSFPETRQSTLSDLPLGVTRRVALALSTYVPGVSRAADNLLRLALRISLALRSRREAMRFALCSRCNFIQSKVRIIGQFPMPVSVGLCPLDAAIQCRCSASFLYVAFVFMGVRPVESLTPTR